MIVQKNGRSSVQIVPVKWQQDKEPATFLNVDCIYEEYGKHAKLYWRLLDSEGNTISELNGENPTIQGAAYEEWDGNNLIYPFEFVAKQLNIVIIKE